MRVLLLCLSCLLASAAAGDIDELFKADTTALLSDDNKWKALFNCLMDRGPCESYQNIKVTRSSAGDFEKVFKIDPKPLLNDTAKWKVLYKCLMDKGPCNKYKDVKDTLPKLILNNCEGCTPEQKEKFDKTLQQFLEKYPKDYADLGNKLLPSKTQNDE